MNLEEKEIAIEEMREWFFQNYEDPGESCPYESASGGYIYIWGGPYDANECLQSQFSHAVEDECINELVSELEDIASLWSKIPGEDQTNSFYDDDFFNDTSFDLLENSKKSYDGLKEMIRIEAEDNQLLFRMVYAQSISIMEAFLSDFFIKKVINNEEHLINFIEKNKKYKNENFTYSNIIKEYKNIKAKCKSDLTKVLWHNLIIVSDIYKCTLNITFPNNLAYIYKAIEIRHHIVHRNGKDKEGGDVNIKKDDIYDLQSQIIDLLDYIENKYMDLYYNDF